MTNDAEDLESRFTSLEDASRNLSADVRGLNATLLVVADLQTKQREQAARMEKAEAEARSAKQLATDQDRRNLMIWRWGALILAVVLSVISLLLYFLLTQHVNDLIDAQAQDRYQQCQLRNAGTVASYTREEALAKLESDPDIARLHSDSAKVLRRAVLQCRKP
jgi:fatty acid desaturase